MPGLAWGLGRGLTTSCWAGAVPVRWSSAADHFPVWAAFPFLSLGGDRRSEAPLACCDLDSIWPLFISPTHHVPLHSHQRPEAAQHCLLGSHPEPNTSLPLVSLFQGLPRPTVYGQYMSTCTPRKEVTFPYEGSETSPLAKSHRGNKGQSQTGPRISDSLITVLCTMMVPETPQIKSEPEEANQEALERPRDLGVLKGPRYEPRL